MDLKEFKETYFQNLTNQEFSSQIGFDNSFICKVMLGNYKASKSLRIKQLQAYIKDNFNVDLDISSTINYYAVANDNLRAVIKGNLEYIRQLEEEKKELEKIIYNMASAIRLMGDVKDSLKTNSFDYRKYKAKYNRKD